MKDCKNLLKTAIDNAWVETNPAKATLNYAIDRFDTNALFPQILYEPGNTKHTWIADKVYRVETEVKISVYLRPVQELIADLDLFRTTFLNMRTEIDRILSSQAFSISGINKVTLGEWKDLTDWQTKQYIVFQSIQTVVCLYYEEVV